MARIYFLCKISAFTRDHTKETIFVRSMWATVIASTFCLSSRTRVAPGGWDSNFSTKNASAIVIFALLVSWHAFI